MTPFRRRFRKANYYVSRYLGIRFPEALFRAYREPFSRYLDPADPRVAERVNYYNKLDAPSPLSPDAVNLREFFRRERKTAYFFDAYEFLRYFDPALKFHYKFGDVIDVPPTPAFIKSRPTEGDNKNSVLLNLDKLRHFLFVRDPYAYEEKSDTLVWRGEVVNMPHRTAFLREFINHPGFDIGQINPDPANPDLSRPYMPVREQLKHKFILSIEGNDVATNLKWILSSNSLCFMRKPRFETWFMEGKLVPEKHYALVKYDYSDLESRIAYYKAYPDEAKAITREANRYVSQFLDANLERQIALLVIAKYFAYTQAEKARP